MNRVSCVIRVGPMKPQVSLKVEKTSKTVDQSDAMCEGLNCHLRPENGGRSHKPKNACASRSWRRPGVNSPESLQKWTQPWRQLDFSPGDFCWTSHLQNCKITNLCCLKPLSLWYFVTVAIGNHWAIKHNSCKATELYCSRLLPLLPCTSQINIFHWSLPFLILWLYV